jgi:hypothetical protein
VTPPVVLAGLNAYRASGRDSAIATWMRGSALEGQIGSQVARALEDIESAVGSATGHEILANVAIGTRVIRTYAVVHFRRGAMFALFDSYHGDSGWVLNGFLFNTRAQEILPPSMLAPPTRPSPEDGAA